MTTTTDNPLDPPHQRSTCTLPVMLRLALLSDGQSPCAGCHGDRTKCGGEPRRAG